MQFPADMLYAVANKILRGCEYWLANGRIIEPQYGIHVVLPRVMPRMYFGRSVPTVVITLARDDPCVAMYEIVIYYS